MPGPTILLAPTDPTSPLLADGVCGGRVPTTIVHRHKDGSECADLRCGRAWFINTERRALVLTLNGVPVAEGCDRAAAVVSGADSAIVVPHPLYPHGWRVACEMDSVAGPIIGAVTYFAPVTEADRALCDRNPDFVSLPVLANIPPDLTRGVARAWALAHIAAARLNCRVIVLDGGEVRDA